MMKETIRIKVRCPSHRFNPQATDNLGSYRASCMNCERLVRIFKQYNALNILLREAADAVACAQ